MVPFPLPLPEAQGNFSLIFTVELIEVLEVDLTLLRSLPRPSAL